MLKICWLKSGVFISVFSIDPKRGKMLICQWSIHEHIKLKLLNNNSAFTIMTF